MRHSPLFLDTADLGTAFDALTAGLQDPRPHPTEDCLVQLGGGLMSEILDVVLTSALEDHAALIAEALIGGLHAAVQRLDRRADRRRDVLALTLRDFDGSEVADLDLQERQTATAALDVAVRALELVRDAAAETWTSASGELWSPARGSLRPNRVSAAQIDAAAALRSRQARRLDDTDPGPSIVVFRGAPSAVAPEDASRIFDALNWARAQWPDLSLAITGAPGADQIARRWAAQKHVRLVVERPDFERYRGAAPFRVNDVLMALEPVCVLTLSRSLAAAQVEARAFGPVLNLIERAQGAGVRCVRIGPAGRGALSAEKGPG